MDSRGLKPKIVKKLNFTSCPLSVLECLLRLNIIRPRFYLKWLENLFLSLLLLFSLRGFLFQLVVKFDQILLLWECSLFDCLNYFNMVAETKF